MRRMMIITLLLGTCAALAWAGDATGEPPYHIMLVNDDGVDAPGIAALAAALAEDPGYRVTIVAPLEQQSGQGHALVFTREVAVRDHPPIAGYPAFAVDATPASTARMGLSAILIDEPPDLVVSGINKGENVGRIAWYSGTVGAAREAIMAGFPAIALSLQLDWADPKPDFATAAKLSKVVVDAVRTHGLPDGVYLNVNIPMEPAKAHGFRLTRMSVATDQVNRYEQVREEDGVRYFESRWIPPDAVEPGSDANALRDGWVSVVPLRLDATDYEAIPLLTDLAISLVPCVTQGE